MLVNYPTTWQSVFNSPLACAKSGIVLWCPKSSKELTWDAMCKKVTAYFWAVDAKLQKASAKQFGKMLWQRYVDELLPATGKDPRMCLIKLYEYANLAPPGVTRRPWK